MADEGKEPRKAISTIEQLLARVAVLGEGDFVYRGQADAGWYQKSGAVRRVQGREQGTTEKYPDPRDVQDYVLVGRSRRVCGGRGAPSGRIAPPPANDLKALLLENA